MSHCATHQVLKGGSLNQTVLRTFSDGRRIVRKSISRRHEREYGFVRWHSQFKRLQRYNALFPDLFPRLIDAGAEGEMAFIDMDFVEGSQNLKDYLCLELSAEEIEEIHSSLWVALDKLHDHASLATYSGSLALYFEEEVVQRLADAMQNQEFARFCENREIIVDGQPHETLLQNLDWLRTAFAAHKAPSECYTHGNATLENILLVPATGQIVFIDPYEENVVDCREAEYSQILQCSNQAYGYINDRAVVVSGHEVSFDGSPPPALHTFNRLFKVELERRLSSENLSLVRLLEASQFIRMLPFKIAGGQVDKAMYFYGVASRLVAAARRGPNGRTDEQGDT